MNDELQEVIENLKKTDESIYKVSKQWIILKHEYQSRKDPTLRAEIKEKWNKLQKKMETRKKA